MSNKKKYGQFMTTNYEYILQGLTIPKNTKKIIEPFAGKKDLLKFLGNKKYHLECYDIEPTDNDIKKRDTLKDPPEYNGKFVLTNPPYLARNRSDEKGVFDLYGVNDLYKCFMKRICEDCPDGGIIIIPLNFWSSIREGDISLRRLFLGKFEVERLNIFEERVFDDTTYTICSFLFYKKKTDRPIQIFIFPGKKEFEYNLDENNNYLIGGNIYNLENSGKYKVTRLTKENKLDKNITNILAKCIDDNLNNKIGLSYTNEKYIDETPNLTGRTYATLIITPKIDEDRQRWLVERFNEYLGEERERYFSLFLANYRESKDMARKRISFGLVYRIVLYLLDL